MKQWLPDREARLADEELQRELSTTRAAQDLVATLDVDGFLLSLNPAGHALLALPPHAEISRFRMHQFYDETSCNGFVGTDLPGALRTRVWHSERTLLALDGGLMPCSQTLVAHSDGNPGVAYFSLIAHDISSIRAAEAERRALREELFHARKMETMGKLAGGIAHDFNNFLTVIMGHAELGLLNHSADASLQRDLRLILDTTQKAARLTAQLLDYSSRKMIEPEVLDLNQVLAEAQQVLASMLGSTITLQLQLEPLLWPIRFDRSQLEQILFNLAINARDAMAGTGTLTISTGNVAAENGAAAGKHLVVPTDQVCLTVRDTGCGMTTRVMEQIFDPFFTTKERGKGTGLGLAAVYGAVKQNHSDIRVSSTPGAGTRFDVVIPAYRSVTLPRQANENAIQQELPRTGARHCILLVEDNAEIRELLAPLLESLGHEVLTARDGLEAEAVFLLHESRIDLLITDIVMPGKDGAQLAHFCQRRKPGQRVLLMSGHNDEIVYFRNRNQAPVRMLNKPFPPQRLAAEVRAMLESDRESGD
jgi:two-component system cell cycle sensor histidine kinase/response regulator CckA